MVVPRPGGRFRRVSRTEVPYSCAYSRVFGEGSHSPELHTVSKKINITVEST